MAGWRSDARGSRVHVLVLGATGYLGGRVVPELLAAGHRVRCAVRTPAKLDGRPWRDGVEVVAGDVTVRADMDAACAGVDVVLHLVRALDGRPDLVVRERDGAAVVRDAAAAAGVRRIVHVGQLGDPATSRWAAERREVARILASGPVPVVELRVGVVIGSGGVWFELVRHTTELLPLMVIPTWIRTRVQPIAVRDLLAAVVAAVDAPDLDGRVLELGGPDVLTYRELMHVHAGVAGLRRRVVLAVPVTTPRLSALFVGAVTPLPTTVARPLLELLREDLVVREPVPAGLLPPATTGVEEAVRLSLGRLRHHDVATTWTGAGGDAAAPAPDDPAWAGERVLEDVRLRRTRVPVRSVFDVVRGIGGANGWWSPRLLWASRGAVDKLMGGVGAGRGRRHPLDLAVGDAVDLWRVEALEPPGLLRLRAEMRLPGTAWHEYRIVDDGAGTVVVQRALFAPRGLWGRAYWLALTPLHAVLYPRMLRRLVRAAERLHAGAG